MARPSTQAARRAEILEAAWSLLERDDTANFRLADVADELGMTTNAVRYYYRDVEGLMSALLARSDERFYTRRIEAARALTDHRDRLRVTIEAGLPSGADDAEWRVIWRAIHAAGFELDRRPDVAQNYHRQVGLYAELLRDGAEAGAWTVHGGDPDDVARTLMALEDYLGYRVVARDPGTDRATALRLVLGYAELATGVSLRTEPV